MKLAFGVDQAGNAAQIDAPDPVSEFFDREHEHAGGYDLHPEFRPWAQRRYYQIYGFAPLTFTPDPVPAVKLTKTVRPINLAPQVPEDGGA